MHNQSRFLHQSQPHELRVIRAGSWDAAAGKNYPIHRHTVWEMVFYCSGRVDCLIGNHVFDGRPGVLVVIPPGVMHGDIARTAYQSLWVQFEAPDLPWPQLCLDDHENTVGRSCSAIVREFQEQALGYAE